MTRSQRSFRDPAWGHPSSTGGFTIPDSGDENSSTFQAVESACKALLPAPAAVEGEVG